MVMKGGGMVCAVVVVAHSSRTVGLVGSFYIVVHKLAWRRRLTKERRCLPLDSSRAKTA